ncbi:MAG: dienelactone hydrolase family protein [Rhodocyclales bacterium]|nr:dienelactone hydrolase family protein [Rhodocyclales bacterium]
MKLLFFLGAILACGPALAQPAQASDLQFPAEPSALSAVERPRMALLKPEGVGPFPALVLVHQCGGLGSPRWQNQSMLGWAKDAVARGYVALLVDSLGPRGVDTVCYGPKGGVFFSRGVKDALQAAEHLQKFDFVDRKRIALAGFSWGAMVSVLASSARWSGNAVPTTRFAAAVAFYPGCFTIRPPTAASYEIVQPDIDRPLLVLMGQLDNETPADECAAKLGAAKAAGAPIEWHVYPQATHCWDCSNLDGFSKTDVRGTTVTYRYSVEDTTDSRQRMFQFLDRVMGARP